MARIFRPKYPKRIMVNGKRVIARDRNGNIVYVESRKWAIKYTDAHGHERIAGGYTDKLATEQKAARLGRAEARRGEGIIDIDPRISESSIDVHIKAWLDDLERCGRARNYRRIVKTRINRLKTEMRWTRLSLIQPDQMRAWLRRFDGSDRTKNHYLDAAVCFCNWAVTDRRLESIPLQHVARIEHVEPVSKRRALTIEELARLAEVHPRRGVIYLAAALTGLRSAELRALQWGDLHLDATRPYIALRAATTKSRRSDSVAVNEELRSCLIRCNDQ